jgi:hypothetical protein
VGAPPCGANTSQPSEEESTVADEKSREKPKASNEISPETGQFDARFILWRTFCAQNQIPVETLPSELTGDTKDRWEKLKADKLKGQ